MCKKLVVIVLVAMAVKLLMDASDKKRMPQNIDGDFILFTSSVCAQPCEDAREVLAEYQQIYREVLVSPDNKAVMDEYRRYGGSGRVPLLVSDKGALQGFQRMRYLSFMADTVGYHILDGEAYQAMSSHFDAGEPKVVMYATSWCPYCAKTRAYFAENDIAYEERDAEKDTQYRAWYRMFKANGYPLIYIGAKRIEGFSPEKIEAALAQSSQVF